MDCATRTCDSLRSRAGDSMIKATRTRLPGWPDIHPNGSKAAWKPKESSTNAPRFPLVDVAPIVGMSATFIRGVVGRRELLSELDVETLLSLDEMNETFVPRSRILDYLTREQSRSALRRAKPVPPEIGTVTCGDAHKLIRGLGDSTIDTVVTSTPYWGVRIYGTPSNVEWADGEACPFGHEQTPEGFIRHSAEILFLLFRKLCTSGSIWWNVGDTFNTRTQIRESASETLTAMRGLDKRKWTEQNCRRYSAGHSFLADGEQALIPQRISERASRMGYLVRSAIIWRKDATLPEPTLSRVSRSLEHILHLAKVRAPYFDKGAFRTTPASLGGRNPLFELDQVTDVWHLPTANGGGGHGAQFPVALAGRCISLSTPPDGLVLDPFAGSGTTGVAAAALNRRFMGFDVSPQYVAVANQRLAASGTGKRISGEDRAGAARKAAER